MGEIAGVLNLESNPVEPGLPGAAHSADGRITISFDGRLDNRKDLIHQLELSDNEVPDALLAAQAYEKWGNTFAQKLSGDFAIALWDRRSKTLLCARDFVGIRPLYYWHGPTQFIVASELSRLFQNSAVPREINEGVVAEYLCDSLTSHTETLYKNIFRLPPAHFLKLQDGKVTVQCYLQMDERPVRYATDEQYAERFLEILTESIRCRIHGVAQIGCELSGGLDSSSVTALTSGLANSAIHVFSLVFPGMACDESRYIQSLVAKYNLRSTLIGPEPLPLSGYRELARQYCDFPEFPNGAMMYPLLRAAGQAGCKVILTGLGGDERFAANRFMYYSQMRRAEFGKVARSVQSDANLFGLQTAAAEFFRSGIRPIGIALARRLTRPANETVPEWIQPDFARRTNLPDRLDASLASFQSPAQQTSFESVNFCAQARTFELLHRADVAHGVERRHPFWDRRLIEFLRLIPEEQRRRGLQTKFILRKALSERLPAEIGTRLDNADFSHVFSGLFKSSETKELLGSLHGEVTSWVVPQKVQELCADTCRRMDTNATNRTEKIWPLWNIIALQTWWDTLK